MGLLLEVKRMKKDRSGFYCAFPRCSKIGIIEYLGFPICGRHWAIACKISEKVEGPYPRTSAGALWWLKAIKAERKEVEKCTRKESGH